MLNDFTGADKIYIACGYTDLRRGIDGLAAIIQQEFKLDPFANALFLFCGRRRDRIKARYWEGNGFVRLYKRLEGAQLICPRCGETMSEIGKEVVRTLKIVPAQTIVKEDIYYTYACRNCEKNDIETPVVQAPREKNIIPGGFATPEAIAHIVTQKFVMASPLYRQEQELKRMGISLSRQTMSNWILRPALQDRRQSCGRKCSRTIETAAETGETCSRRYVCMGKFAEGQNCAEICFWQSAYIPGQSMAVPYELSEGRQTGAVQQSRRADHQAFCDGSKELAVCKCAGRCTIQCCDLQLD